MTTRLQELEQRRATLLTEGTTILDAAAKRDDKKTTSDEDKRLDAIDKEVIEADTSIGRERRHRDHLRGLIHPAAAADAAGAVALLRANQPRPFATFGDYLVAVAQAAMGSKTGQPPHPGLIEIENFQQKLWAATATGASEGSPADGGFLVQTDFATEVLQGMLAGGEILSRVRRIPMSSNANGIKINAINETSRALGSRWGGIRAYWAAEAAALTASRPKFRRIELELHKLIGLFYATSELLQDASALEAVARNGFTEELRFAVEDAIFQGTGAGQPLGILNAGAIVSQAKETGQAAATVVAQNIMKMVTRIPARNFANAVWYINQEIWPQLVQMYVAIGTGGQLVYMPPTGVSGSPWGTLYGRPVVPIEYAAALGTVGDIVLADMSEYIIIDKGTMDWAASMHVQFLTDEMTYRMTYRIDGQPTLNSVITAYKGTATQAHFVSLATRA